MLKEAQDYHERYQSELKFLKEIEKLFQFAKTQQVKNIFVICFSFFLIMHAILFIGRPLRLFYLP